MLLAASLGEGAEEALPEVARPALYQLREVVGHESVKADLLAQQEAEEDPELKQLYDEEVAGADARIQGAVSILELELAQLDQAWPLGGDGADGSSDAAAQAHARDAVLEFSPGVGGKEAALFAGELLDMYERYCQGQGWTFDVQNQSEATGGGLQSASVKVSAGQFGGGGGEAGPFGWLQSESGVHRVQRIPETERKGRMQTSSAAVVVMPVAEEADVVFGKNDLKFEISKKSSGPGGQSVNAAYQAVRVLHVPTGVSVFCATGQCQIDNRKKALDMLRTQMLNEQISARAAFVKNSRREQRGTADRSEKIRTYNFQRDEVVDHRLGKNAGSFGATDTLFGDELHLLLREHQSSARLERLAGVAARIADACSTGGK